MKISVELKTKTETANKQQNQYSVTLLFQTGVLIRGESKVCCVSETEFERYKIGQVLFEG